MGLLTVASSILPMRCPAPIGSGTVLWSALLPTSRETGITHTGQEQGGGVRQVLPVRRSDRVFMADADPRTGAQRSGKRSS